MPAGSQGAKVTFGKRVSGGIPATLSASTASKKNPVGVISNTREVRVLLWLTFVLIVALLVAHGSFFGDSHWTVEFNN